MSEKATEQNVFDRVNELRKKQLEIWQSPNLLEYLFTDLNKRVKFDKATKGSALGTAISSCIPDSAINLFEIGTSGVGKTINAMEVLKYFPQDDIWYLGGMSPKSLVHDHSKLLDKHGEEIDVFTRPEKPTKKEYKTEEEFKEANDKYKTQMREYSARLRESYNYINIDHKILVFLETPDPETMHMLYPILSHDTRKYTYKFVDKTQKGGLRTVTVVLEGFPASIFLTVDRKYIEELSTRSLTASPEEHSEKFEAANKLTNFKAAVPWIAKKITPEFERIRDLITNIWQTYKSENIDVVIPLLDLYKLFPKEIARDMRDFQHFTYFIKAIAVLHSYQRLCLIVEGNKYVIASAQDVVNAYALYSEIFETTTTGSDQRILDFYYDFMFGQAVCSVDALVTSYNTKNKRRKPISDYSIRAWLDRLNVLGYVEKREDQTDKRRNVYIPLVKERKKICENTLNPTNHVDLMSILKNSFKEWKEKYIKNEYSLLENIFSETTVAIEDLEARIIGTEKIISIFNSPIFKLISNTESEQSEEKKIENTLEQETNVNSRNSAQEEPYFKVCYFCGKRITTGDWIAGAATENKPAHKECYDRAIKGEL